MLRQSRAALRCSALSGERRRRATGVEWTVSVILPDEFFREMQRPVLVLSGTKDGSDAGERWRRVLPDCHFMLVYDAGRAIGAERPEALAFMARILRAPRPLPRQPGKRRGFSLGSGAEISRSSALRR